MHWYLETETTSITKRGKKWRVHVRQEGISASATFDTKAKVKAWADDQENFGPSDNEPKNFREVLVEYHDRVTVEKSSAYDGTIIINKLIQAASVEVPLTRLSALHLTEYRD